MNLERIIEVLAGNIGWIWPPNPVYTKITSVFVSKSSANISWKNFLEFILAILRNSIWGVGKFPILNNFCHKNPHSFPKTLFFCANFATKTLNPKKSWRTLQKKGVPLYTVFPRVLFLDLQITSDLKSHLGKNIPIEIDGLKSSLRSYLISLPTFWFGPKTEALQNVFESGPVAANRAGSHVKWCENELHPDGPDDSKKRGPCSTNRRYGNRSRFRIDRPELVCVHRCPVIFGMTPSRSATGLWPLPRPPKRLVALILRSLQLARSVQRLFPAAWPRQVAMEVVARPATTKDPSWFERHCAYGLWPRRPSTEKLR